MPERPFSHLAQALQHGDQDAARLVFDRFADQLIRLAAAHLPPALRGKTDPESAVQSAFKSFFAHHAEGAYHLTDWDGLWGLLTVITIRKCGHRLDRFNARKRAVAREQSLAGPDDDSGAPELPAPAPSPLEAVLLRETVEQLFARLKPRDHEVILLRLKGYEVREIAERLGQSERGVARVLKQARDVLNALTDSGPRPTPTDEP
jgi:RNA polymerase sigma-70 factor (ECF subfamily)